MLHMRAVLSALLLIMSWAGTTTMLFLSHNGAISVTAQCDTEVIVLVSDVALVDPLGSAVAIDDTNALIGAESDDTLGSNSGAAYVFSEVSPGTWVEVAKLVASDGDVGANFGYSVDIHGNNAVIGAYGDDDLASYSGAAYIFFQVSAGTWVQVDKLVASDGDAIDYFGHSVGIYGSNVVIGVPHDDDVGELSGAVHVFSEVSPGDPWVHVTKLVASDGAAGDRLTWSLAMDGTNALAGAHYDDGPDDMSSATGAAYIFSEISTGTWAQVAKLVASDGAAGDQLGCSSAIHGTNAVIGAWADSDMDYHSGSAYIFSEQSPGTWVQVAKLVPSDGGYTHYFGSSVAIHGKNALIGSYWDMDVGVQSGSAYVYSQTSTGDWIPVEKLIASDGADNDQFGQSVALSSTTLIVGTDKAEGVYFFQSHREACVPSPCSNDGVCISHFDICNYFFECDCNGLQFTGGTCEKSCNNGFNNAATGVTSCNCTLSGATGKFCTEDVDDCLSSPCINGGTCSDYGADLFPNHAHEFNCSCPADYYGLTCSDTLCYSSPCLNNGTCGNGRDFVCNCTYTGYEGEFCESEIDECASSPCLNDGICTDLLLDFACDCASTGYEGPTCNKDINDCASSPCLNDGVCQDKGANKFKCNCDEFWEGKTCEINIDDCVTNACQNEAVCVDGLGNYTCNCTLEGYEGEFCDVESDECASSPCEHDGVCIDLWLDFSCDCSDLAYEGELCDIYIPCLSVECQNGGTCDNDVCLCPSGYTGEVCEETLGVAEPMVFEISFASFARDNDTAESFASELPVLLAEATPNTVPSDFEVRVLDNDGQISYEVTFQNYQELELAEVQDAVQDAPFVEERINGDVAVTSEMEEEEEDEKKEEGDMTWLIIVLVLVGVALIAGGGYAAKQYHDKQKTSSKLGTFKANKLNMPI